MIKALSYGAPPHGSMAPGIDRIMLLANEKNIERGYFVSHDCEMLGSSNGGPLQGVNQIN